MTISDWLLQATKQLQHADIETARLDAELILAHTLGNDRTWLIAHGDDQLDSPASGDTADLLLQRRINREPIAYLTGTKEFYGRTFTVTSDVLIPRPETETLIDMIKERIQDGTFLDVGCGSGCIGITAALEIPELEVTLADISEEALKITNNNILDLDAKASAVRSDLLEDIDGEYDFIVANLPYVDPDWERSPETDHEPSLALFADNHGLELIYKLVSTSPDHLTAQGYLLLEADPEQHSAITDFAQNHGFREIESRNYALLLQLA